MYLVTGAEPSELLAGGVPLPDGKERPTVLFDQVCACEIACLQTLQVAQSPARSLHKGAHE